MPRRPKVAKHPYREDLEATFRGPLSRSCGYPSCHKPLTVDLFKKGKFMGATYCTEHQVSANNRRRALRHHIRKIERLINDEEERALINQGQAKRLTKEELIQWRRRLQWELNGFPSVD